MNLASALTLALCVVGTGCSEPPEAPEVGFEFAGEGTQAQLASHGKRVAAIVGCRACHGDDLQGKPYAEAFIPDFHSINLTRTVAQLSDAELEAIIRDGVHPQRGDLWLMPSGSYHALSERDVAGLIAYLRSEPPQGEVTSNPEVSEESMTLIAEAGFGTAAFTVSEAQTRPAIDLGPEFAQGRYIAIAACVACHGSDLTGIDGMSPDLLSAAVYSEEAFNTLLDEGKASDGRELGLMRLSGPKRFSVMTASERKALHAYLLARAEKVGS